MRAIGKAMTLDLDTQTACLRACPLLAGAAETDLKRLAAASHLVEWHAGQQLFRAGDPARFLIIILSGRVKLSLMSVAGRELTLRIAGPSSSVGEIGLLDGEPRSADATAIEPARGLVIHKPNFERVLDEHPALARAIMRFLAGRLRDTTYQLESLALYDLNSRLARFFLASIAASRVDAVAGKAVLDLRLSQSEVAAILGASRPKINRALAALEELGAMSRAPGGFICDIARLRQLAEGEEV